MPTPDEISGYLRKLEAFWHKHPEQRLGQLLCNLTGCESTRLFFLTDREWVESIEQILQHGKVQQTQTENP